MQVTDARLAITTLCAGTIDAFRNILPWDGACIYQVDEAGQSFDHHLVQMPADQLSLYRKRLVPHDPLAPARYADSASSVVTLESAQRNFDSRLYVDTFLNPYDRPHEVELFFRDQSDRIIAGLGLFRTSRSGRFRMADIDLLGRVRPLAECAFRMAIGHRTDEADHLMRAHGLTRREMDVIALVRKGATNREIAEVLRITVATVKAHLFNAYDKVGVSSRTEMLSRLYLSAH